MKLFTHFPLLSIPLSHASPPQNSTQECKCTPTSPCWPPPSSLSTLNTTLSGSLLNTPPPASVCYPTSASYNLSACARVRASWFSSSFHAADPTSIGWPWWAHNSCPPIWPNGTSILGDPEAGAKGCGVGAYPALAVNATTEGEVVAAVRGAREWGVRVNVKSTGHSFQGRSTGFGTFSVWTHYMRGVEFHDKFQAEVCADEESHMAFTFAAGERVRDVYEAADKHGAIVVAGSAQDVGIVGWFTGGGHGPLSSTYGLGVDNVLQVRIVTAAGELLTANRCQNSELFWAIRGGGGGTFGVVTSVTMKAYPSPRVSRQSFSMSLIDPSKQDRYWDLVAAVMSEFPKLKEGGMQGYSVLFPPGILPGPEGQSGWTWTWGFDVHDKPNGTIEALFEPIARILDPENSTSIVYTSSIQHAPNFFSLWNSTITDEPVALGGAAIGSRLLPASALSDTDHVASVLRNISTAAEGSSSPPVLQAYMIANNHTGKNGEVSVTPAWADAVLHFIISEGFNDSDTFEQAKPTLDRMTYQRVAKLKELAPESGAYFNEGDPFDPNWQYDFWGQNYARLKAVKKQYDPDNLLWCLSCVGSEEWYEMDSGQLCKASWAD
ncbi:FAD-binding domain-containing protein [Corynespora cassiicola Philippines]|uniref:FAD-binding domain-containing protein n=1 Tax=Corynespora cassiicola Philippines TaxID=1448308 RepID=A0A2T2NMX8_CORCC|nr:FAD-binding domain-containing protein [Corynespora cassiicola Philippines]